MTASTKCNQSIGEEIKVAKGSKRPFLLKNAVFEGDEKTIAPQTNQSVFDARGY